VPTLSPRLAAAPAIREKPPATLAAKPEESAKPEPAASLERVIRARERPKPVVERDEEKPARLARHRVKAKESARRTIAAVREKPTRQRSRAARARVRDYDPADQGGDFRVSTTRTYILPDGRRMVTYAQPRGEDVRELVATPVVQSGPA
jgi:hypothetical protein